MIFEIFPLRDTTSEDLPRTFETALEERALKFDLEGAFVTVCKKSSGTSVTFFLFKRFFASIACFLLNSASSESIFLMG